MTAWLNSRPNTIRAICFNSTRTSSPVFEANGWSNKQLIVEKSGVFIHFLVAGQCRIWVVNRRLVKFSESPLRALSGPPAMKSEGQLSR